MSSRYNWDYSVEELRSKLNSIIQVRNEDNFQTHFRHTMLFRDENKVTGVIENNSFKIWTHEQGRSGVTGIFYPVVKGQIRRVGHGFEMEFKSNMNIVGKIVFIAIAIMLAYGIVTGIVIQANNEFKFVIRRLLIGVVIFGGMISVPSFIYFRTSRIVKKYLIKELGLRNVR